MGDASYQRGDGLGEIKMTLHLMVLRGLILSLPTKKPAKANLVI